MTTINSSNPLKNMLDNTFDKLDQDQNKSLDRSEFKAMYEVLKAGIAVDRKGQPKVSEEAEFARMDHNGDGLISKTEMQTTDVLMPAALTDESLNAMIAHLRLLGTADAANAASLLSAPNKAAAGINSEST